MTDAIENVQVLVDDRERPSGVVSELEKLGRVVVKIERLEVGDYCVDGAVLIERKTAADFAQSLMDGFNASPTELLEVEGIGSKTAAAIDQIINCQFQAKLAKRPGFASDRMTE